MIQSVCARAVMDGNKKSHNNPEQEAVIMTNFDF